jgi:fusion and transport protein UGO1
MASHHHHHHFNSPPNPLRPYYIPPPPIPFDSSSVPTSTFSSAGSAQHAAPSSYAILQDFQEYSDYLESPSAGEAVRRVLDQAILKYTSILISQPFEVAKTVLQCQYVPRREGRSKHHGHPRDSATAEEDVGDSEEEEAKEESEEDNPWTTFETEVCTDNTQLLVPQ